MSDRTRELRDAEQQHLADEAMRRALAAADRAPRDSSTQLADALLRHEVLERADIERIMAVDAVERARRGRAGLRAWRRAAQPRPTSE